MESLALSSVQSFLAALLLGKVFWPYFAGAVVLIVGLARMSRTGALQARGIDRAIAFGPLFFAAPMAVFGGDHFIAAKVVIDSVPSWIPWHLFWVYLVGTALIAASLSIVTKKYSVLAATLLSAMIFCFVLLIHIPNFVANPGNRILFAIVLRDSSFSGGALMCAVAQAQEWPRHVSRRLTALVRYVVGVAVVVFGAEHFLHPEFVPVVPLTQLMPPWIPGHLFVAYVGGAVLIACGLSMILNWRARLAASWLGIYVFVVVVLVYLPIMIANLGDIGNGLNYFADTLAYGGAALLLARALPSEATSMARQVDHANSAVRDDALQRGDV